MSASLIPLSQQADEMSVADLDARSWRKDELTSLARALNIPTKGTKAQLLARVRTTLVRRVVPPTVEVHVGPSHAVHRVLQSPAEFPSSARPDFFAAAPDVSRAWALAQWFARRTMSVVGARQDDAASPPTGSSSSEPSPMNIEPFDPRNS